MSELWRVGQVGRQAPEAVGTVKGGYEWKDGNGEA